MNKRPAHPARGLLYCAATSLLLMGPTMVHARSKDADETKAKSTASKTTAKTKKVNPLFSAVKRELSKLKGDKTKKTTAKKTTKSKKRQPIRQTAGNEPLPSLDKQPTTRRTTSTRTRKPGLLDRLLGRDKPRTRPRRVTSQQNIPKKSNGIPGLLPSFLRPKSKQQSTARRLPTRSKTPQRTASKQPTTTKAVVPAPVVDDLDNAFPELTEAEADNKNSTPSTVLTETKPEPTVEENPFTGKKLDDPSEFKKPVVQSASNTSEEKPVITGNSLPPLPLETAEEPKSEPQEDAHEDKLKRLAQREAMSGFKGFCPVALRDRRDLIDTDSEITSSFEGKTYEFSTVDAKDSFEADPGKYAPTHRGNDVIVLTEGNVELKGTLENAVWFKDRLYLFSSAATLETFVGNPAKYAKQPAEESKQDDAESTDSTDADSVPNPFDDMEADFPPTSDEESIDID